MGEGMMGRLGIKGTMGTHEVETFGPCYGCGEPIFTKSEDEGVLNDLAQRKCICLECQKIKYFSDISWLRRV